MTFPYGAAFAALCLFQGALVAASWRRPWRLGASRWIGLALPVVVFLIGLAATRGADWSVEAVAHLATFATPILAGALGAAWGWRWPAAYPVVAALLFLVAWRADGLPADVAGVLLVGAACLTLAAVLAAATPQWALAAGLVVLAVVDAVLVFANQVGPGADALHAVVPLGAGGEPLPALQDASLDRARFGWLDILAPALAATFHVGATARRHAAAVLTGLAALAWGLLLAVADSVPGTVPPLVAVGLWWIAVRRGRPARGEPGTSALTASVSARPRA